jgi:hypothetical protein
MSKIKESMRINDEFLDIFEESKVEKKNSKKTKEKKGETAIDNFKENIMVFIETSEIVEIKKLLDTIDKLKR